MLILLPILLLFVVPLLLLGIRLFRPKFSYYWLICISTVLIVWPIVLLLRSHLPVQIPLLAWQPEQLFPVAPAFLLDSISWPFALALVTILLSTILTDVSRVYETPGWTADWATLASGMLLTALGLVSILADNPITLLLGWAGIDVLELLILLVQNRQSFEGERIVIAFITRVAGIVLVLVAALVARSTGAALTFSALTPQVSIFLLLASGMRLGVIPLHFPITEDPPLRRSLGTLLRLAPVATALVLLVRIADVGVPAVWVPILLFVFGLSAIYGGLFWTIAQDELDGRTFWIIGMAAFSMAAAVRAQPQASLAWGIALLLSGALLFLASARHPRLVIIMLLGLLGFCALPFTPAWQGMFLYARPFQPSLVLFVFAQALLLAGYIRHALRLGMPMRGAERWIWLIYPWGLVLLPLTQFIISIWNRPATGWPSLLESIPAIVSLGLVGLAMLYRRYYLSPFPERTIPLLRSIFSFEWLYRFLWGMYRTLGRLIAFLTLIFEGEGGLLWTLLLLALLFSLLVQSGLGG